jgi:regulator of protease activity HflC (stomatin/prohibitin superfamily)
MVWLVPGILVLIAGLVMFVVRDVTGGRGLRRGGTITPGRTLSLRPFAFLAFGVFVLFGILSLVRTVGATEVGIPVTLGHLGAPLDPGVHFTLPWTTVTKLTTRLQEYTMVRSAREGAVAGDDSVAVLSNDGGQMNVDVAVKYRTDKATAPTLFRLYGSSQDINTKTVRPETRSIVRDVYGQHSAVEDYSSQRAQVSKEIEDRVRGRLQPKGIDVDSVNIREIYLSPDLQKAVTAKLTAQQAAQQAQFDQDRAKTEAETARIRAQGEATANEIRQASLTAGILCQQWIDALKEAKPQVINSGGPCGGSTTPGATIIQTPPPK